MRLSIIAVVVALVTASCGQPPPPPVSPPPAGISGANLRATCPLGVQNAHVKYDETATGAKLTFDTSPEHLDELRERVRDASALHGTGARVGRGHDGKHGVGGGKHGLKPKHFPPINAIAEDTTDGARILFTPQDPKDLEDLRATLRLRMERMMARCE